ncbi:SOS response-associated peptidase family protein [Brevibacillus centrosporus]|uniref:SOS response-associated peptidase family protein n=1 Tax=Brevibacillus centrosporus TaxID=54910 RepID=UPI002E1E9DB0|nr:SOS response-associated peptidase family protein [Brevibacillus centrosporus]
MYFYFAKHSFAVNEIPFECRALYNAAPGQKIPAIIEDRGERRLGQLKWGLVLFWAKDEKIGYKASVIIYNSFPI